jgi:hypothetical protein
VNLNFKHRTGVVIKAPNQTGVDHKGDAKVLQKEKESLLMPAALSAEEVLNAWERHLAEHRLARFVLAIEYSERIFHKTPFAVLAEYVLAALQVLPKPLHVVGLAEGTADAVELKRKVRKTEFPVNRPGKEDDFGITGRVLEP